MQRIQTRGLFVIMIALLVAFGLAACGQKGDLYHPEDKQTSAAADHPYT
ncbi:MAG TPA: lipoprotein [Gammaproteobacteria bacterium]|nr:lipoprotein [Gammaproteobacteria bacterium]